MESYLLPSLPFPSPTNQSLTTAHQIINYVSSFSSSSPILQSQPPLCLPLYLHLHRRTFKISKPSWPPLVPSSGESLNPSTQSSLPSSLFSGQSGQESAGTSMGISSNTWWTFTRFSRSGRRKNRYAYAVSSTLHTPTPTSISPSSIPPPAATPSAATSAAPPRSLYTCSVSSPASPSSTTISSSGIVTQSLWSISRLRRSL